MKSVREGKLFDYLEVEVVVEPAALDAEQKFCKRLVVLELHGLLNLLFVELCLTVVGWLDSLRWRRRAGDLGCCDWGLNLVDFLLAIHQRSLLDIFTQRLEAKVLQNIFRECLLFL